MQLYVNDSIILISTFSQQLEIFYGGYITDMY